MLTCLEFQNFRAFSKLKLDGFQRVNLVIGKNNTGKTSLLEGLITLLDFGSLVPQVCRLRGMEPSTHVHEGAENLCPWFIRDLKTDQKLSLLGLWESLERDGVRHVQVSITGSGNGPARCDVSAAVPDRADIEKNQPLNLGDGKSVFRTCTVPSQPGSQSELLKAYGMAIQVRGGEEAIESVLKSLDSRIQRIRLGAGDQGPQIVIDLGLPRWLPLSQLGQGTSRAVRILSEIIGSGAKVCLIDGIDEGIHQSQLFDLWKGIAAVAKQFDVQIFATTQSVDCVKAAHAAFAEQSAIKEDSIPYDLALIQLQDDNGQSQGKVYGRAQIAAAVAGNS